MKTNSGFWTRSINTSENVKNCSTPSTSMKLAMLRTLSSRIPVDQCEGPSSRLPFFRLCLTAISLVKSISGFLRILASGMDVIVYSRTSNSITTLKAWSVILFHASMYINFPKLIQGNTRVRHQNSI